jgi:hypothetical protein
MANKNKKPVVQEKEPAFSEIQKKFKQNPGIYIGSVVILVLVTVTFIGGDFLSGGGFGGGGGDLTFGYYDRAPISYVPGNVFVQNLENITRTYQAQGIDISDFRISAQIWRQAFERAVTHTAVLQIMARSNYSVPERLVDREVARLPMFQEGGRFSPALYRQMSESTRLSLWRHEQEKLTMMMYFSDFAGLLVSGGEADFIARMSSPLKSFDMVSFRVDNYPDSEYLSYAMDNMNLFNSIHMSRITLGSGERDAARILASVRDGTITFEDAARNHSQDVFAERGGDMGSRMFYELDREILNPADRQAVYGLRRGEYSNVIMTTDGWAFFRVENELTPPDFEDEIVMDRVRSYVRNFQRGRMEDWAITRAREFIADVRESDFLNAARWSNLERRSFGPLPVNFGSVDFFTTLDSFTISGFSSQELRTLARNENFWRVLFSTQLLMPSEPLVHGNNVFVFYLTEETEADESSIEALKATYSAWWLDFITEQALQQYFLSSPKMEDRFWEVYFRSIMP